MRKNTAFEHALQKGVPYGFIPHRLEIPGHPRFNLFPFNVMFMRFRIREDGKQVSGKSLYEPDLASFKETINAYSMIYHNIYGGDNYLEIEYDPKKDSYLGIKYINGVEVGKAVGRDWHMFFVHLTILGLSAQEKCEFEVEGDLRQEIQAKRAQSKAYWNEFGSGVKCIFNTVIIKFSAVDNKYPGGFEGFDEYYKGGFQTDGELIIFCFMGSEYYQLINELVESGLQPRSFQFPRPLKEEYDFCFFEPPFFINKNSGFEIYNKNSEDLIEYFYRGEGKERRVWARLKKLTN